MRTWITNRPATSFYLLTLTLSWGYWLTPSLTREAIEDARNAQTV